MPNAPCLLTPVDGEINTYTAKAGTLNLVLADVVETTRLDTVDTSVFDITTPGTNISVPFVATTTSLTFVMEAGKRYYVSLTCVQLINPFSAKGQLKEVCGQVLDTISAVNLYPGYCIQVAS
jgi:hypothetical protein